MATYAVGSEKNHFVDRERLLHVLMNVSVMSMGVMRKK